MGRISDPLNDVITSNRDEYIRGGDEFSGRIHGDRDVTPSGRRDPVGGRRGQNGRTGNFSISVDRNRLGIDRNNRSSQLAAAVQSSITAGGILMRQQFN